jgi:hypothetical protein
MPLGHKRQRAQFHTLAPVQRTYVFHRVLERNPDARDHAFSRVRPEADRAITNHNLRAPTRRACKIVM